MQAALALLPIILQLLPTITVGVEHLIAWITAIRAAAQQSGEWTNALEQKYQAALIATKDDPAYKPASAGFVKLRVLLGIVLVSLVSLVFVAVRSHAVGLPGNRTISFTFNIDPNDLGGMPTNDYLTNITFTVKTSANCTVPKSNWSAVAVWSALQFTNQGPPGTEWSGVIAMDGVTRFYCITPNTGNGGQGADSPAATWVPNPQGVTVKVR